MKKLVGIVLLCLFFIPAWAQSYDHQLKSGKTLVQHIYDSHYEGAEKAQSAHAAFWRDTINGYFYYKSKIDDEKSRLSEEVKKMFPQANKK